MQVKSITFLIVFVLLVGGAACVMVAPNPVTTHPYLSQLQLGLDLQGGTHVILEAQDTDRAPITDEAMNTALEIIRFRVDNLGVSEPLIQRQGDRRIIVELAGIDDPEQAVEVIGQTAMLEFKDDDGNVVLRGDDLSRARAAFDPYNRAVVHLELKPAARRSFADATTANIGKPIHIYLDDELIQSPMVQSGGIEEPEITGYPDLNEAQRVAMLLNSGALPIPLEVVENRIVSATLGQDSVEQSKLATAVAAIAVASFMVISYRIPGVVASLALASYGCILAALLININAVLTLPGIAGIVLSVGMAVDANVIVFERIKDEIRSGKTLRSSLESGFMQAFRTIIDANVTTLIGACVLFYFGAGPIRGFAVTLSLGILVSMFTAVVITRSVLRHLVKSRLISSSSVFVRERAGQEGA